MQAHISKTDNGYNLTVNGISLHFRKLYNLVKYSRMLGFNLVHNI